MCLNVSEALKKKRSSEFFVLQKKSDYFDNKTKIMKQAQNHTTVMVINNLHFILNDDIS